jgi:hypothetical protein
MDDDSWRQGRFSAAWIAQPWTKCATTMPTDQAWVLVSDGKTVRYRQYSAAEPCWKPDNPAGRSESIGAYQYWAVAPALP